jgi:tetratricopeptide (TPR) repeat protein
MGKRLSYGLLILLGLLAAGAAPVPEVEDLVREGNAAYARGEYDTAAGFYERAEEPTTDPGLVAFNKAAALAGAGKFAEAETSFWLSLGDAGPRIARRLRQKPERELPASLRAAAGPRLARVLYNLGTCVLQQSRGKNADLTDQAVVLLDHCLRLDPKGRLRINARHNLELAREFLRLNPKPPNRDNKPNTEPSEDTQPPKERPSGTEQGDNPDESKQARKGAKPLDNVPPDGDNPQDTEERTAGKGNLRPLLDQSDPGSLTAEEAAQHLRQALQRILGERREFQKQANRSSSPHVRDW